MLNKKKIGESNTILNKKYISVTENIETVSDHKTPLFHKVKIEIIKKIPEHKVKPKYGIART